MSELLLSDTPAEGVLRLTLNRPEKRNPLSNDLRGLLFSVLETSDRDPAIRAIIIRGAGACFSAGYDLKSDPSQNLPYHSAGGIGHWPRHVVEGFFRMWDLATPIIAQVHGYCLAGGTELAAACDLVYVSEDAQIGYPVVRSISPPDNQFFPWIVGLRKAMEMMLTGDAITGQEAVECGFANRAFAADNLDSEVLQIAEKIARVPPEIQQINKRAVHRQMEIMGIRAGIRAGTELQTLATFTVAAKDHFREIRQDLTSALSQRDKAFGDYREDSGESDGSS